jgi:acetyltransferase-like isoleucine patch superfamily enzyme
VQPLTSVLMPAFNSERTIRASVESVLQQTEERLELIVVDDGSAIPAAAVLADLHDPRLRILRHSRNRNTLNRGVLVGHHTEIGDHASVMPGANIAGNCRIGEAAFVGMGAIVLDNLSVGAHSVVAAGSLVTQDIPERVQVMGAPARVVNEGIGGR